VKDASMKLELYNVSVNDSATSPLITDQMIQLVTDTQKYTVD